MQLKVQMLALSALLFGMTSLQQVRAQTAGSTDLPAKEGSVLSFERVFASPSLSGPVPREVQLSPDGNYLTLLRNTEQDRERYDLWGYDRESSQWRMLVDSLAVGSGQELSEAEKMQLERQRIGSLKGILSYKWAADGEHILFPLEGELYQADLAGKAERLPLPAGEKLNAVISPRGGYASFVQQGRLFAYNLQRQELLALTPQESSPDIHWGEAEFVAQEEMGRLTGYWWSPDDSRLVVARVDETPVAIVTRSAIGAEGTNTYQQRYPLAGTPNASVQLYILDPRQPGTTGVRVDLGSSADIYVARVDWSADGNTLYVQRQNREQTVLDMLAVDPATGDSQLLFSEKAAPGGWLNLSDNYRFLADGRLLWWSERDGFGHFYLMEDGNWQQLTRGEWVVTSLAGVDEKAGRIFFTATRDSVLEQHIYSLSLADPGSIVRLSEPGFTYTAVMDKQGQALMVARSSPEQHTQSYLADTEGTRLEWIEENRLDAAHPYAPYLASHRLPSFGELQTEDGTVLHWLMITPELEPGKRYPVFFEHYGGPGAQRVTRRWLGPQPQAIVDRGYIYFQLDNRGSTNRGTAFEQVLYRAMGSTEVDDQRLGARYLQTLPFVDSDKIAIYGWSYGGYMKLKMLEADPGLYAAGIAGAPVTRWELYDTHYTERYMGMPQVDTVAYQNANTLDDAGNIADPLLLVHGMADDNVVFENSTAMTARLQASATPFEMMFYPGHTHVIAGPKINAHLWETIFTFLRRNDVTPPE